MKKRAFTTSLILLVHFLAFTEAPKQTHQESGIKLIDELGFLSVLDHKIQLSRDGTYFNYTEAGGQDILFPFSRLSGSFTHKAHSFVLIYQPLSLKTEELLIDSLLVDNQLFSDGTPMQFTYNFPFYRFSYLYNLLVSEEKNIFAIGLTIQIRNATISFQSLDGELFRTNRDVGIVPALKLLGRYSLNQRYWVGFEADGIYAPVSYLNGDDNDVTGAILDANIRAGLVLQEPFEVFLNIRYLGGGAQGQSDDINFPGDGYVKNWLHFLTISLGGSISL